MLLGECKMSENLNDVEVKNDDGRDLGQVARDLAKGAGLVALGVGLGTADYFFLAESPEFLGEHFTGFLPAYTVAAFTAACLTNGALGSVVQGVGTVFGYDPLKFNKEEHSYDNGE